MLLGAQAALGRHWLYLSLFSKARSEAGTMGTQCLTLPPPFHNSDQCFDDETLEETTTTTSASLQPSPAALRPMAATGHTKPAPPSPC